MANAKIPTPDELRNLLEYDPDAGLLTWRARPQLAWWNAKYAGRKAFTSINSNGYLVGSVNAVRLQSHRVVWTIFHGSWPEHQIDHVNGNKTDNRIINLRSVSAEQNQLNQSLPRSNTSGAIGVTWDKSRERWKAKIGRGYKTIHLGNFGSFEEAVSARKLAEDKYGFHKNHGRP